jgi:hypothetical protein
LINNFFLTISILLFSSHPFLFITPMAYSTSTPAGQAVQNILNDLPGLMAIAIVDISSGMSLASHTNSSINPDTAAAYNTEVVKQKQKAMAALKLQGETMDDILITLTNQLHLIKLVGEGKKFIYLVVNSRETNLAIAREVLRAQSDLLK